MGFLSGPSIPAYVPPVNAVPEPEPPPPPKPQLDADLPQTEDEVKARMKSVQDSLKLKQGLTGLSGLKIPLMPDNPVV